MNSEVIRRIFFLDFANGLLVGGLNPSEKY